MIPYFTYDDQYKTNGLSNETLEPQYKRVFLARLPLVRKVYLFPSNRIMVGQVFPDQMMIFSAHGSVGYAYCLFRIWS